MIIKAYEYQKIKKLNHNIFLFYGENDGYKNQVINEVFIKDFKGKIERFEESEILNNFTLYRANPKIYSFNKAIGSQSDLSFGFLPIMLHSIFWRTNNGTNN